MTLNNEMKEEFNDIRELEQKFEDPKKTNTEKIIRLKKYVSKLGRFL